jgi:hypothetical protein
MSDAKEKFEYWGVLELMGHQRAAGRLSEQQVAGANLLRVDIPQGDTFRTVFYGSSAIYAVHITDEAAARAMAKARGTEPAFAYELQSRLPAPSPHYDDTYDEREEI